MQTRVHHTIHDIGAGEWDALGDGSPFLRHAFLAALEDHGSVGPAFGWLPRHLAVRDAAGTLLGAAPLFLKDNSYGEFVFDWAWADAYQRAGLAYYPKLVSAIPYTPATGPRLLAAAPAARAALADGALDLARELDVSSLHWLFPPEAELAPLLGRGLLRRTGVQFHWHNRGYRDFADFLDTFTAHKRKKLKRERARVQEAGIEFLWLHGDEISDALWPLITHFYRSTFDRKFGYPTFDEGFFRAAGRALGRDFLVILAQRDGRPVAGAICYRDGGTLYGRHWGADEQHHSLHFEACYYQGIEYCIREGLARFEPGAQGEHKVGRGFEPVPTWSAHWIADGRFRELIGQFVQQEHAAMTDYIEELSGHLPYRQGAD